MSPIKNIKIHYEVLNRDRTFSQGDTVAGAVIFTLSKKTQVKGLMVKAKGDAHVHWSEGSGENQRSYRAHRRYFKLKEFLVVENSKGTALPEGVHRFKFRFEIPQGEMPSSFRGAHGKIVYMLEAKMCRSWWWSLVAKAEFNFVPKSLSHDSQAMCPQSGSVAKTMGVFSKRQVQMSATINRKLCSPGDTLSVVVQIHNSSSKKVRPKFSLQQRIVYRTQGSTKCSDKSLCKIVGDTITLDCQTVSRHVMIPANVTYSVHHCENISVEYYLKVYLDISFAIDPVVVFPLVIVPSSFVALQPGEAVEFYPGGAAGGPSYSDFPPPSFPVGPYPVPAAPGAYGYPEPDPTQHEKTSGYNQRPQQVAPHGFSTAASSSVPHRAPTAPPLFPQEEEPPSYTSLFPPSQEPR